MGEHHIDLDKLERFWWVELGGVQEKGEEIGAETQYILGLAFHSTSSKFVTRFQLCLNSQGHFQTDARDAYPTPTTRSESYTHSHRCCQCNGRECRNSFLGTHLQHLCYALCLKFLLHIAKAYLYFKNLLGHHFLCVPLHDTSRWYS